MTEEKAGLKQMPAWGFVVIAAMYLVAGGAFGVGVGRDLTVSHPQWAATIDTYIWPIFWVALLTPVVLSIWLGSRGVRAERGTAAERPRE